MGLAEMLASEMGLGEQENNHDENLDNVLAALNRPKITGLVFGDRIKGKKMGETFRTKSENRSVIFVRYLSDAEKVAYNAPKSRGAPMTGYDAVHAYFLDKRDGEVMLYLCDTSEYERVEEPAKEAS